MKLSSVTLLGACLTGLLYSSPARGAIVYVPTPFLDDHSFGIGSWPPFEDLYTVRNWDVDFDGDGQPEIEITSLNEAGDPLTAVSARPFRNVEIVAAPKPAPLVNPEGLGIGLIVGDVIDGQTPTLYHPDLGVRWGDRSFRLGYFDMLTAAFNFGPGQNGQGGTFLWDGVDYRYLAVRFERADGWHYAWLRASGDFQGLHISGYAWETEAEKGIVAGAIPEPCSFMLLGGAAFLVLRRRQRDSSAGAGFGQPGF